MRSNLLDWVHVFVLVPSLGSPLNEEVGVSVFYML